VTARPATGLDEGAAVAAWVSAQAALGRAPSKARQSRVRAKLRDPLALGLVSGDPVVGMLLAEPWRDAQGRPAPGVLHLSMLFVAADAQGQGHGTALLDALLARYPRVRLWAGEAAGFFAAQSFTRTGRVGEVGEELESAALQEPTLS
jgi:ribosomal protein S18 acetylase RimI-like enzyme